MQDIRKTEWLQHGAFGVSEYRIWKRFSDGSWHQRHEYRMLNGEMEFGEWIPSEKGFIDDAK